MATGGMSCVKCITFSFNLLFALSGVLLFLIGVIVEINYSHFSNFVSDQIWTAPIIMMVVGAGVAFICFLGCCGTIKESSCMILSFVILAIIVFVSEIGLGIAAYVKHAGLQNVMEHQFNSTMKEYNNRKDYRDAWSLLQSEMDCCGTFGPNDWEPILKNNTLPASCCSVINLNEANECTVVHSHTEGCMNKLFKVIDSNTILLASVTLVVAGIQLLTILLACCLYRSFRGNYQNV